MIQSELTPYWTPLRYHEDQYRLWHDTRKLICVVAGRRSGKTDLARRRIVLSLALKLQWPNPIYAYCLPTYNQAKKVAWKPLLDLIPDNWVKRNGINVSDMSIETIFGSTLYVMGMDKPQRIEGLSLSGVVIDESSDQKPGVFDLSILPALTDRNGWCWRIGVPKRSGIGRIEFREFFESGLVDDTNIGSYTWRSSTVMTEEQLAIAKSTMTEEDFDEQFNAVWIDAGGSIYYAFSSENLDDSIHYNAEEVIHVGADFNVDPMCWTLSHIYGENENKRIEVFEEIFLKNTNTVDALTHLFNRYGSHSAGWRFYCDASSRQRKTSANRTDYVIIKNDTRFKDSYVYYPQKNPALKERYDTVNAALRNAKGERRLHIHPKCKRLITDLRMMAYKEGTTDPENYTGTNIGHMSDGLGYMVTRVLPMKVRRTAMPSVVTTK